MKRIIMLVLVMVMIGGVVESLYSYVPLRYRPYYYSPYAGRLVPYDAYYSPYAFSYKNPSGLVSDYCSGYYSIGRVQPFSDVSC